MLTYGLQGPISQNGASVLVEEKPMCFLCLHLCIRLSNKKTQPHLYPFCIPYDNPYVALALASANGQAPQTAEAFPLFTLLLPQTAEVIPCAIPQTTEAFPMLPLEPKTAEVALTMPSVAPRPQR